MAKITLPVTDIFYSLQGEGKLVGTPSIFIRLAGCPVRCSWCDTPKAWNTQEAQRVPVNEIIRFTTKYSAKHIVITGGEPLIHRNTTHLADELTKRKFHITLETAGIVFQKVRCDLLSLSPKLPGTIPLPSTFKPAILKRLINQADDYQIKFVVANRRQIDQAVQLLEHHTFISRDNVMLMPNAKTQSAYRRLVPKLAKWSLQYGLALCPRLQLELNIR